MLGNLLDVMNLSRGTPTVRANRMPSQKPGAELSPPAVIASPGGTASPPVRLPGMLGAAAAGDSIFPASGMEARPGRSIQRATASCTSSVRNPRVA